MIPGALAGLPLGSVEAPRRVSGSSRIGSYHDPAIASGQLATVFDPTVAGSIDLDGYGRVAQIRSSDGNTGALFDAESLGPTYASGAFGKAGLYFNGVNQSMQGNFPHFYNAADDYTRNGYTQFFVLYPTQEAGTNRFLYSMVDGGGDVNNLWWNGGRIFERDGGPNRYAQFDGSRFGNMILAYRYDAPSQVADVWQFTGGYSDTLHDRETGVGSALNLGSLLLGRYFGGPVYYYSGYVGDQVGYFGALSDADLNKVVAFMRAKWGI